MKTIAARLTAVLLVLFLFSSCDLFKDFWPFNKEIVGDLIVEKNIDANGGVLEGDSIVVSIPEGALTGSQKVQVYKVSTDSSLVEEFSSDYYQLHGIPEDLKKPITVRILLKREQQADEKGFVYAESRMVGDSSSYKLVPYAAAYENRWLEADVVFETQPDPEALSVVLKSDKTRSLSIFGDSKGEEKTEHFVIYYQPKEDVDKIKKIGAYLETAVSKFKSLGFQFSIDKGEVQVMKMKNDGGVTQSGLTGTIYMNLNSKLLSDMEELKSTIGHEVFHWVQYAYDKAFWAGLKNVWLDEAFAVWSESLFHSSPAYWPKVMGGHLIEPFQGIQRGAEHFEGETGALNDIQQNHGYGMASLIKYLVDKYGTDLPLKVYEKIKAGMHPVKALYEAVNLHLPSDYEKHLEDILLDKLFANPFSPAYTTFTGGFNFDRSGLLTLSKDTSVVYKHPYADLSGRVYLIDFTRDYAERHQDLAMKFKVKSFLDPSLSMQSLSVYQTDKKEIEMVGKTQDSLVVHFKDLLPSSKILVLVTNSNFSESPKKYSNARDLELTIENVPEVGGVQGGFIFDCIMRSQFEKTENDTISDFMILFPYIQDASSSGNTIILDLAFAPGKLLGNLFMSEFDVQVNKGGYLLYSKHKGKIEIQFNDSKSLIKKFNYQDSTIQFYNNGTSVSFVQDISCVDIPYFGMEDNCEVFRVQGAAAGSHITGIDYHETFSDGTRDLLYYWGAAGSGVTVAFKGIEIK